MSQVMLEALVVREKDGKSYWTKVGAAFPSRDGVSFVVRLEALPLDGVIHLRPKREHRQQSQHGDAVLETDNVPF